MLELLRQPWPWYVVGPMIAFVMLSLNYFGKSFGISSNLRTFCAIGGAGKINDFFKMDWKKQQWNLLFVVGTVLGGYFTDLLLVEKHDIALSSKLTHELEGYGIITAGKSLLPHSLFSWEALWSIRGMIMLIGGGILVGFGTRYAGGCTSGHAITGLSDLQLPSLYAVIGFFIGGLIMTYFLLPTILNL